MRLAPDACKVWQTAERRRNLEFGQNTVCEQVATKNGGKPGNDPTALVRRVWNASDAGMPADHRWESQIIRQTALSLGFPGWKSRLYWP